MYLQGLRRKRFMVINIFLSAILLIFMIFMFVKIVNGEELAKQAISEAVEPAEYNAEISSYVKIEKYEGIKNIGLYGELDVKHIVFSNLPEDTYKEFVEKQNSIYKTLEVESEKVYTKNSARKVNVKDNVSAEIDNNILSICYEINIPNDIGEDKVINTLNIDLVSMRKLTNIELMMKQNASTVEFSENIYSSMLSKDMTSYIDTNTKEVIGEKYKENKDAYVNKVITHISELDMYIKDKEICCQTSPKIILELLEIEEKGE